MLHIMYLLICLDYRCETSTCMINFNSIFSNKISIERKSIIKITKVNLET